jgi:hypothetical protein
MNQISLNSSVSFNQSGGTGNIGEPNYYVGDFPNWYPNVIKEYYPIYYPVYQAYPNRFEQAFKILMKLIEKKVIKMDKVQEFAETINAIVDIL